MRSFGFFSTYKMGFGTPELDTCVRKLFSQIVQSAEFGEEPTSHVDFVMRLLLLPVSLAFFVSLKRKMERKLRH
ncbi:MAG: hypothetical protein OXC46_09760 [Thaumarchaeota archaeon]|nr:hypothetical protein [Nitrososphaerota archaeon]